MIISELQAQEVGTNKFAQPSIAVCVLLFAIITAKVDYFFSSTKFLSKKIHPIVADNKKRVTFAADLISLLNKPIKM